MERTVGSQRGAVLTMTLVFFMVFLVITTAWLGFAVRQSHEVSNQEQEEQAFYISEAGVEYTLFLLNSGTYTTSDLLNLSGPIVQGVQDGGGNTMGTYELAFGDNGITPLTVTALAYDAQLTGRCQQIVADIDLMSGAVGGPQYYVRSWDHVSGVACEVEDIVTVSPPTIVFSPAVWILVMEGDPPPTVNQVIFTVVLSQAYPLRVTVDFATSDFFFWPATSGEDYIPKSETIVFSPGETTKMVTVDIVADDVRERWMGINFFRYEYFRGVLSSPTNGSLGGANSRMVRIEDDD